MKPHIKKRGPFPYGWEIRYRNMVNVYHGDLRGLRDWWFFIVFPPKNDAGRRAAIAFMAGR